MTNKLIYKELSFNIIGLCMEVHKKLGAGFVEVVYKDALEYELIKCGINFQREKTYSVEYKDIVLKHQFYADFVIENKIIIEVKAVKELSEIHASQTINYLKVSKNKLGLLINFGEDRLTYKRYVL